MSGTRVDVKAADGTADCYAFSPTTKGPWPAVLFFQDGLGLRPSMHEMAQRLCDAGFYVFMPNMFYRAGAFAPFDPNTVWTDASERARIMTLIQGATGPGAMQDAAAFMDEMARNKNVHADRIGTVGYCMGGALSFRMAGSIPDRVAACASIHGGYLVTDPPGSPHLAIPKMKSTTVYLGVADNDRSCTAEHQATLEAALQGAGIKHQVELYKGALHGFAVPDMPVYDRAAAEQHWTRILALFDAVLKHR